MSTQSTSSEASNTRRLLRRAEVEAKIGFKRAFIYKLMKLGKFPKPVRTSTRAVRWDSIEIDQWIAARVKERT